MLSAIKSCIASQHRAHKIMFGKKQEQQQNRETGKNRESVRELEGENRERGEGKYRENVEIESEKRQGHSKKF